MTKSAAKQITPEPVPSRAELWAKTWGETVSKSKCARMLGVSKWMVYKLLDANVLELTADGQRIFTRSVAQYAEMGSPKIEKPKPRIQFVK